MSVIQEAISRVKEVVVREGGNFRIQKVIFSYSEVILIP